MAARFKVWVCCRSLAGVAGSNADNNMMSVSCECCVLSGRGPGVGPITHPEERDVSERDLETSIMRRLKPTGAVKPWKKIKSSGDSPCLRLD
jgi:hypothetical protein